MSEEGKKEWFYTSLGNQRGPVSFEQLKSKVLKKELHPEESLIWREGMEDWVSVKESLEFSDVVASVYAPPKADPKPAQPKKNSIQEAGLSSGVDSLEESLKEARAERRAEQVGGVGRLGFILIPLLLQFVYVAVVLGMSHMLKTEKIGESSFYLMVGGAGLLYYIIALVVTLSRFKNLGMTRWWVFGYFVPILNFWVAWRQFACPPNYAATRKLDTAGVVLTILYWLVLVVTIIGYALMIPIALNAYKEGAEKAKAEIKNQKTNEEASGQPIDVPQDPTETKQRQIRGLEDLRRRSAP